jgi:poly(beta-D-mannuronate) lyase
MKKLFYFFSFLLFASTSFAVTYTVSSISELHKTSRLLQPGDTIVLANGTYENQSIVIKATGTAENPIVITAETQGKVYIEGRSTLRLGGEFVIFSGFVFRNGYAKDVIQFRTKTGELANNCRLTNCVIDGYNNPDDKEKERWVLLYGKNNRIDHCTFINKQNEGVLMAVVLEEKKNDENSRLANSENYHQIDHNFFGERPKLKYVDNGGEIIRIGDSNTSLLASKTIVENNVFEHCDGEVEIISVKSCENILRNNYFYESAGALVLRHGNKNLVEGNVFIGNMKKNSAGIRVINADHIVRNNYLETLNGKGSFSALSVMNALESPKMNEYHPVKNVRIENNILVDCRTVSFNLRHSDPQRAAVQVVQPENVAFEKNTFYNKQEELQFVFLDGVEGVKGFQFKNNVLNTNAWTEKSIKGFKVKKKIKGPSTPARPVDVGVTYYFK